jgi:hypothetical protein
MPLLLYLALLLQAPGSKPGVSEFNTPDEIDGCLKPVTKQYKVNDRINPFYLRGDFHGDGKPDYAVLIVARQTGERGVAICRASMPQPVVLGAGTPFNKMRDLSFEAWSVYAKHTVERGVGQRLPPKLIGEAISIIWPESASAIVYWDGKVFRWYQQGD